MSPADVSLWLQAWVISFIVIFPFMLALMFYLDRRNRRK